MQSWRNGTPTNSNIEKKKKAEILGLTSFGIICIEKLRRMLYPSVKPSAPAAVSVVTTAAPAVKKEEPVKDDVVKQERKSTPEKK